MSSRGPSADPAQECQQAIKLAIQALTAQSVDPSSHKLIAAQNVLVDQAGRPTAGAWRLTFKPRDIIPDKPDMPVTAGGEVFVEVDLGSGVAKVAGYGE